ncbi:MAG: riboflavin kinase [Planctomycetota bacterium]
MRDERHFPGLDALRAEIAADVERARAVLAAVAPDGAGGGR